LEDLQLDEVTGGQRDEHGARGDDREGIQRWEVQLAVVEDGAAAAPASGAGATGEGVSADGAGQPIPAGLLDGVAGGALRVNPPWVSTVTRLISSEVHTPEAMLSATVCQSWAMGPVRGQ
jgi:hypothetical protein